LYHYAPLGFNVNTWERAQAKINSYTGHSTDGTSSTTTYRAHSGGCSAEIARLPFEPAKKIDDAPSFP
jgi:hypothetical protein